MSHSMPPGPVDGSLTFTIECTSSPTARFGTRHPVTIHADWTVETPHDIESERIAAAFGAWSSCIVFADRVVPAYRHVHDVLTGAGGPRQDERGKWRNRGAEGCPGPHTHSTRDAAVRHDISTEHLARRHRVPAWRIDEIVGEARRAWTSTVDASLVEGGAYGFAHLWGCGIHPVRAARIAESLPRLGRPFRQHVVQNVESGALDPEWVAAVADIYPTKAFLTWVLDQTERSRTCDVEGIRALRDTGIGSGDVILALDCGVSAESIAAVSSQTGVAAAKITRWLALWARIGCMPDADHYRLLDAMRLLTTLPRDSDVTHVVREALREGRRVDRTEVAVMLAVEPSPVRVLAGIRSGAVPSTPVTTTSTSTEGAA